MAELAKVVSLIQDTHRAEIMLSWLLPHKKLIATYPGPNIYSGPITRFIALLYKTLGQYDIADQYFKMAYTTNNQIHSPLIKAQLAIEMGDNASKWGNNVDALKFYEEALSMSKERCYRGLEKQALKAIDWLKKDYIDLDTTSLKKQGEFWQIHFCGVTCQVKNTKGFQHIAALLLRPNKSIHVLELVGGVTEQKITGIDELSIRRGGDINSPDEVIDMRARNTYKKRLSHLRINIEESILNNDLAQAEVSQNELELVMSELQKAYGKGGKLRETGSDKERARVNVTRAIQRAIAHIAKHHKTFAQHLEESIKTGTLCIYKPVQQNIHWTL